MNNKTKMKKKIKRKEKKKKECILASKQEVGNKNEQFKRAARDNDVEMVYKKKTGKDLVVLFTPSSGKFLTLRKEERGTKQKI
jgi:hypothetical protein